MATASFWTMRDFDLFAYLENDELEVEEIPEFYDFAWEFLTENLNLDDVNDDLTFHEIRLKSGYYSGLQIYIEEIDNPHEMDNEETRYYFDLPRSVAIRKYDAEIRKIRRWMEKKLPALGFVKLHCVGIFSNGEAIYKIAA